MKLQEQVIEKARELFPNSISDVEAVGYYATKVFSEIKSIESDHPKYYALGIFYIHLTRLKDELHKSNIELMSSIIKTN